ncbi:short-chain dehydrogenase [Photobacterium angustum]|uniref:SDR family NAD(P)-dependent oxidoreductase n=1 Tax=Photobacterium angustum TaxID=661 RepID=UPI0005E4B487|nr:SDR family NAD(P)-dependent oxidoreductase [Photobacterium angustum]KJG08024.1 short-chain dehydrogenase [Photobacterium angustum]PSV88198.1 KR domain-containing protein [Photobacterium angustum]PSW82338.1 KR domain-containing protein [Photobacterium angustum]
MNQVLITGASSGIGKQLACDYADNGWRVIACGQNAQRLDKLQEEHQTIETLRFDVTDFENTRLALTSLETLPELIILNAGTCEYINEGKIDTALVKRVFDVNVYGVLHCIEALQARFNQKTHLVIISSSASFVALPRAEAYGASKAAMSYITQALAVDLAFLNMKITLVNPGFVKTPLTDKNDFTMPMLVSPEYASKKIRSGIAAGKKEISFPATFTLFLKSIALLPITLRLAVIKLMTGKS